NVHLGDSFTIQPENVGELGVQPIISLGGTIRTSINLVLGGTLDVRALELGALGFHLGPVINEHLADSAIRRITLFQTDPIEVSLGTVRAKPINMNVTACVVDLSDDHDEFPDPGVCGISAFNTTSTDVGPDGYSQDFLSVKSCLQ